LRISLTEGFQRKVTLQYLDCTPTK
jgi:hypothetical protein